MSNSKKLEQDAAKHRGFEKSIKDGAHPMNVAFTPPSSVTIIEELSKQIQENLLKMFEDTHIVKADNQDWLRYIGMDFANPSESEFTHHIEISRPACAHTKKHVVHMTYSKFMYCPDCKKDLGDVK